MIKAVKPRKTFSLLDNSRFYILMFSAVLSIAVFAWLRLSIESDQLLYIRAQQAYGFICLGYLYIAMIISPLGHIIGKQHMGHVNFARRAIGVSAFYFALLHALIALFGQLGGLEQIQYLPDLFKWSLLGGAFGLIVLGLMVLTSFDKAIQFMTFRKWKWLHRLVYAAGIFIILHVWMIGTHLAYTWVQIVGFVAVGLLLGLEILRMISLANKKRFHMSRSEVGGIAFTIWIVVMVLLFAMPYAIQNYHSRHTEHDHSQAVR